MRRVLSILLFWATLFPTLAPLLSTAAMGQSTLPACCRRDGKHHCTMSPEALALILGEQDGSTRLSAPPEQCPYRQHSLATSHLQDFTSSAAASHAAAALHEPTVATQAECLRRIAFDRSHQKRGPPTPLT